MTPEMALISAACAQAGYGEAAPEFRFDAVRRWRFDLAFPALKVAFEREGFGTGWGKTGRHQTATGMSNDCEKYNTAQALGWAVIRGTPPMIKSGAALEQLLAALKSRSGT